VTVLPPNTSVVGSNKRFTIVPSQRAPNQSIDSQLYVKKNSHIASVTNRSNNKAYYNKASNFSAQRRHGADLFTILQYYHLCHRFLAALGFLPF
jgi:hypothetical protein